MSTPTTTTTTTTKNVIDAQTKILVVDGLIGAGKSTLVTALHSYLQSLGHRVVSCLEPVQQWMDTGILNLFYKDKVRHAYAFQTYTFVTRIQSILEQLELYSKFATVHHAAPKPVEYLILERSVLTDRYVFMKLMEDELEPAFKTMYASWFDLHSRLLPFDLNTQAHFVYLQTSPEESMVRMNQRGRREEVGEKEKEREVKHPEQKVEQKAKGGVSLQYQQGLHTAHLELFKTLSRNQTTILDSKLCLNDFTHYSKPGFLKIVDALQPFLQLKSNTNKETSEIGTEHKKETHEDCDRSYLTAWDRMC